MYPTTISERIFERYIHHYDFKFDEDMDYDAIPAESNLISAISHNDLEVVKALLEEGISVNAFDDRGYTALHEAVSIENLEIMEHLLQQPEININAQTLTGSTPLHLSTTGTSSACAMKLLSHGADVSIPTFEMETPLHQSVRRFHDVSLELLKRRADVDAKDCAMHTPLHLAAVHSDFEMVSMLVYYGACADVTDYREMSPFMAALNARAANEIQELLMELEVDYNRLANNYVSTLFFALICHSPLCLELIERGAHVHYVHPSYCSVALSYYSDEVFQKIWEKFDDRKIDIVRDAFKAASPMNCAMRSIVSTRCTQDAEVWLNRMRSIFLTDKGTAMVLRLSKHEAYMALKGFIESACFLKISEDDFYSFLSYWLCYGTDTVFWTDAILIYGNYGFTDLLYLLLHMTIVEHKYFKNTSLVNWMCDVTCKKYFDNLFFIKLSRDGCELREYYNLMEFGTPSYRVRDFFFKNKHFFFHKSPEWCEKAERRLKSLSPVPSLIELCRNSARTAIIKKYNIKDTSTFYCFLNWLRIPNLLKQTIAFKIPVNTFYD